MALFLTIVLAAWTAMHAYVFWRLSSISWIDTHFSGKQILLAAIVVWLMYPASRFLDSWGASMVARPLEYVGAVWMGVLFLLLSALVVVDAVTLGGWLWPGKTPVIRGWAAGVALVLSAIALAQALRPPVVREYEVRLAGLPRESDGLILVALSDLHLGTLTGRRWLERIIDRVNQIRPDIIAIVGDLIDGNVDRVKPMVPSLEKLRAPHGVWAVTGNHEFYAGLEKSVRLIEETGFTVLRNRCQQVVPGLVFAGVDDLTARAQYGSSQEQLGETLANRPPGAAILLSHTPWEAEVAARNGVGLMLSGHTHEGQVWPFTYLVKLRYALIGGRYSVEGMEAIVCRGTGTWGPPLRLWRPSEFLKITLRTKEGGN